MYAQHHHEHSGNFEGNLLEYGSFPGTTAEDFEAAQG